MTTEQTNQVTMQKREYDKTAFTKRNNKLWKDLGNYIVYSDGRVFSKRRGIFLVPNVDGGGYLWVRAPKAVKIHRLLAIHFMPNPRCFPVINHKDGNKQNNSLSNLEWCTIKHNAKHAFDTGLNKPRFGADNPASKIKYIDAMVIKEALIKGHKGSDIARYFKVSRSTIYRVRTLKTWRDVA